MNVLWVICGIWVGAVAMGSVQLVIARAQPRQFMELQYYLCQEGWTTYRDRNIFNIFMLTVTYALPLIVLAFSYYKVGIALWKRETPGNADVSRDQIRINSKRKVRCCCMMQCGFFADLKGLNVTNIYKSGHEFMFATIMLLIIVLLTHVSVTIV